MTRARHFAALDALRGIAAFSVLTTHIGIWLRVPGLAVNAGLAVEFFFCLSGFVLALAYQDKLKEGMSALRFAEIRLLRLMPIIIVGTVVSAAYVVVRALVRHQSLPGTDMAIAIFLGMVNLPHFTAPFSIGGPQVFPLNMPQYTLFLELFVNAFWFATIRARQVPLSVFIILISIALLVHFGGGGHEVSSFWNGFPRVFSAYFVGVLVFHIYRRMPPLPALAPLFWVLLVAMFVVFALPFPISRIWRIAWILVLTPALVLCGTQVTLPGWLQKVALWLGALSYPIYALHYPIFCWVNGTYQLIFKQRNALAEIPWVLGIVLVITWLVLRYFDEPVRSLLGGRLRRARVSR